MINLLLVIAIAVPLWYAYRHTVAHGMVAINHVTTFSFGFLLYWISPMAVGVFGSQFASRLSTVYFNLFDKRLVAPYLATCIGLYLTFVLGDSLGISIFHQKPASGRRVPKLALTLVTFGGCILTLYTLYTLRAELLVPYTTRLTFKYPLGTLTACVILLGVVALMFAVERPTMPWRRLLTSYYCLPFLVGCAALLWLGNRLNVVTFLFVMSAVYQSNFRKKLKLRTVVWGGIALVVILGMVAIWRGHLNVTDAAFSLVQEPVLGSLSLVDYLDTRGIAWINSPVYLASDFTDLIPALLLPGKAALRKHDPVFNPLGGLNSYVSFNLNFGVLGTAVFLFLLAFGFRYLKSRSKNTLFATMYVMCAGWMAFTFYRDPFYVSIVKALFQDSFVEPIVIVAFGRLLYAACAPKAPSLNVPSGYLYRATNDA
jgi:hypothetical protein